MLASALARNHPLFPSCRRWDHGVRPPLPTQVLLSSEAHVRLLSSALDRWHAAGGGSGAKADALALDYAGAGPAAADTSDVGASVDADDTAQGSGFDSLALAPLGDAETTSAAVDAILARARAASAAQAVAKATAAATAGMEAAAVAAAAWGKAAPPAAVAAAANAAAAKLWPSQLSALDDLDGLVAASSAAAVAACPGR